MTEYVAGGRRRIDKVLDPEFLSGVGELTDAELRDRRHEAEQEEVDISYARRLLQGRVDILRAEQQRRLEHGHLQGARSDAELVASLAKVLADERHTDHGLGRHLTVEPSRVGEHRREAERAVSDVGASDPASLDDQGLAEAIRRLADIEARLSTSRRQVQEVADQLADEVAARYRGHRAGAVLPTEVGSD